jgi:hypothetical protein
MSYWKDKPSDPVGASLPRGKAASQRKSGRDGTTWTPSERYVRDGLMRQFMRTGSEGEGGNSAAWRESPVWCESCGMYLRLEGRAHCARCAQ